MNEVAGSPLSIRNPLYATLRTLIHGHSSLISLLVALQPVAIVREFSQLLAAYLLDCEGSCMSICQCLHVSVRARYKKMKRRHS